MDYGGYQNFLLVLPSDSAAAIHADPQEWMFSDLVFFDGE